MQSEQDWKSPEKVEVKSSSEELENFQDTSKYNALQCSEEEIDSEKKEEDPKGGIIKRKRKRVHATWVEWR